MAPVAELVDANVATDRHRNRGDGSTAILLYSVRYDDSG